MSSVSMKTSTEQASSYYFEIVKPSKSSFNVVKEALEKQKEPFYGDQSDALNKISAREDRRSEMLYDGSKTPVGFIVYKKENQSEFAKYGLADSLEVKSFVILKPESPEINLYGPMLLNRLVELAQKNFASHVYLTISERESTLWDFLKSKGFEVKKAWNIRYINMFKESLISLKTPNAESHLERASSVSTSQKEEDSSRSEKKRKDREEETTENRGSAPKRERDVGYSPTSERGKRAHSDAPDNRGEIRKDWEGHRSDRDDRPQATFQKNSFYSQEEQRHELTLRKIYIHQIQSGKKTIEGRINSGIVLRYRPGDTIRFFYKQDERDDAVCRITKIERYTSFEKMLRTEGFKKCLADVATVEEAIRTYDAIPGYTERAAKSGVVALHLELIPKK